MESQLVNTIVLVGALGVGAQWLAWRFHFPAIVLLTLAGLVAGPGIGWLRPEAQFGPLLKPIIGIAVAVILFEGGLHLRLRDLRGIETPVRRMVLLGVPLAWALGSAAAHYLAGLAWPVALLLGGILVVTGPTVVIPLLRQAKLERDTAAVLKWEGIVNDPVGALLAVVVLEVATAGEGATARVLGLSAVGIAAAAALGFAVGKGVAFLIERGHIAEFLKGPAILGIALACYLAGNVLQNEAGLAAVTVLGVTLANTGLADIDQMRRLKEYITVILVSGLFIILAASLERGMLAQLGWGTLAFVAAVMFVVRPLSTLVATFGTALSWRHRLLVGWIAPRGIVAVSMAGLLGTILVSEGFADGGRLVPLTFAVVIATVVLHGFTIRPLGRYLGLAAGPGHGVLIVGADRWSTALAVTFGETGVPVVLSDTNPHHLEEAREAGVETFRGEILSDLAEHRLDFNRFEHVLAATDDDTYNALVCTQFAGEVGTRRTLQLAGHTTGHGGPGSVRASAMGRVLMAPGYDSDALEGCLEQGWRFVTRKAADLDPGLRDALAHGEQADGEHAPPELVVAAVSGEGEVRLNAAGHPFQAADADTLILFTPDEAAAAGGAPADEGAAEGAAARRGEA